MMKIRLVAFEDGIVSVGFRRISALVKKTFPSSTISYIYNVGGPSVYAKQILSESGAPDGMEEDVPINSALIDELADADVVGFSCVSKFASHVKSTIAKLRQRNKNITIVWGGVHATVFPEDAIQHADAVCIGEGEKSFISLLREVESGKSLADCQGFWTKVDGQISKNPLLPLLTAEELAEMPYQDYGFDIRHVTNNSLTPMTKEVYISQQGSKLTTLWVLGCPFLCTYCANSTFIRNDQGYGKIRHKSPARIIDEIVDTIKVHDYVTYIEIQDDNLLFIKHADLEEFCRLYKERVNLPLFIPGLHPNTVKPEKIELLIQAGLKKVRMGIQAGSENTLKFFRRNTSKERILRSVEILASFYPTIIPPFYDIIIDNPVETEEDKAATLALLREMKRPYTLYVFSLRIIPGTELSDFAKAHPEYSFTPIESSFRAIRDRKMGMLVYLLALYNPSDLMFGIYTWIAGNRILNRIAFPCVKLLYELKRLYYELKISNYQPLAMISPFLATLVYRISRIGKKRKKQAPRVAA